MSNKPASRRCGEIKPDGKPCKAWAVLGTDPPQCSAHAGRNTGAGAPAGNQNNIKHGFYGRKLSPQEVADLVSHAGAETLTDEIALARVAVARVLERFEEEMVHDEFVSLTALLLDGVGRIANLMRAQRLISGGAADSLAVALGQVLDEIGEQVGRQL